MSRLSRPVVLPVLFASIATVAFSQTSDTTPPTLVSLSFTPAAVDVTADSQNVTVTARVTDNLAGVSGISVAFISPVAGQSSRGIGLGRISGTALDGVYRGTLSMPQFVASGVWKATAFVVDLTGNSLSLSTANLQSLGFPTDLTVTSIPDTVAPTVTGLTISPSSIDVSSGGQTVTFTLALTDNLSGVRISSFSLTFRSPSGQQQYAFAGQITLISGTALNGSWRGTVAIPKFSEAGTWKLNSLSFFDNAGNSRSLTAANLTASGFSPDLNVISSPADTTAPLITSFNFSPAVIDTSASSQTVTFQMNISDAPAGADFQPDTSNLSFTHGVIFRSPSGGQSVSCCAFSPAINLTAGTPTNGTWQGSVVLPRYSEAGTWKAQLLYIKDSVQNRTDLSPVDLANRGFQTDLVVYRPSQESDGSIGSTGGTIADNTFGNRASVTFPSGALPGNTDIAIDVLAPNNSLGIPTPAGFSTRTLFVNLSLTPTPPMPFPAPGLTVILPLAQFHAPGSMMLLFRLDPVSGLLVPAVSTGGGNVIGIVASDGLSATFTGVSHLSTVVGFQPTTVPGDVNGDQAVNCADVAIVRAAFGKRTGEAGFNSNADLNANGVVDVSDLTLVTRRLTAGTTCN